MGESGRGRKTEKTERLAYLRRGFFLSFLFEEERVDRERLEFRHRSGGRQKQDVATYSTLGSATHTLLRPRAPQKLECKMSL